MKQTEKERWTQYRIDHRDEINARKREWYKKNSEKINKERREWRAKPESKATIAEYRVRYECKLVTDGRTEEIRLKESLRARKRTRSKKIKAIEFLGGKCNICGTKDDPAIYDFHHREPSKKDFNISRYLNRKSWSLIKRELKKCDLVCSNCHRKLHVASDPECTLKNTKKNC